MTAGFVLGLGLLILVSDPLRRAIAMALALAAFGAIVFLTWGDPHDLRRGWREILLTRRTAVAAGLLLLVVAAMMAFAYTCDVLNPGVSYVSACRRAPSSFKGPLTGR